MGGDVKPIQESADLEVSKNYFIATSRPEGWQTFGEVTPLTGAEMFSQGTWTAQTNPTGKEL